MIAAIHQPVYLPWLGFFHKMRSCDVFVLLDDVAFSKNSIENRNLVKTSHGSVWLTVPVKTTGRYGQFIKDTEIDNSKRWAQKHWKTIWMSYHKTTFFAKYAGFFESVYSSEWNKLGDLNAKIIEYFTDAFHIKPRIVTSSSLSAPGESTKRLIEICRRLGADTYFSGIGAKAYQDDELFKSSGIKIVYQDFAVKPYDQLYGEFLPNLSAIDYLFNCDSEGWFFKS